MTAPVTFRDPSLESEYRQRGFVVAPLLDPSEIELLRSGYRALVPAGDHGLSIDYMRPDRRTMYEIAAMLEPIWARHFPQLFADHRPVFTTFVTKHPGEASNMFLHEDRTFVDERRFRAGTLWVPLVDVGPDLDNGGLEVIPKSHLLCDAWSGTDTPELFRPYEDYLRERLETIAVPAGHALYYDTRTLHASPANMSTEPRETIVCAVAPRSAELIHVVATTRRHRRVHRVDEQFYLDVHPHAVDEHVSEHYPVIDEYDDDSRLTPAHVASILGPDGTSANGGARMAEIGPDEVRGVLVSTERRLPLLDHDLPLRAADLPAVTAAQAATPVIDVVDGEAGVVDLLDGDRDATWAAPLVPFIDRSGLAVVLVVDAGGSARLRLDGPHHAGGDDPSRDDRSEGAPWKLDIIDVAPATATVEIDGHSIPLDEQLRLRIDSTIRTATFTNRGPGVLAVLVTKARCGTGFVGSPTIGTHARNLAERVRSALIS